ncbi:hypothetical protein QF035_010267 [Streptomyces umbrinus]|uniref:Mutator family transposase n=1 Tax=Streptomyces umbrinus TaxID=67370 RepID=A0ABU0TA86_9ACTN|nr:hypothetical protein [Streptomyces umbrinus]
MVLSLSAKGLTHGEISAHLAEVYGADVSKTTISTITDTVMDGMAEWQNRPRRVPAKSANCAPPTASQQPDLNQPTSSTESGPRITRPWGFVTPGSGSCSAVMFRPIRTRAGSSAMTPCATSSKRRPAAHGHTFGCASRQSAVGGDLQSNHDCRRPSVHDSSTWPYRGSMRHGAVGRPCAVSTEYDLVADSGHKGMPAQAHGIAAPPSVSRPYGSSAVCGLRSAGLRHVTAGHPPVIRPREGDGTGRAHGGRAQRPGRGLRRCCDVPGEPRLRARHRRVDLRRWRALRSLRRPQEWVTLMREMRTSP